MGIALHIPIYPYTTGSVLLPQWHAEELKTLGPIPLRELQRLGCYLASMSQRVHVGIWYILRAQRGSHIPTLRPKYTPYSYMDPLGKLDLVEPT